MVFPVLKILRTLKGGNSAYQVRNDAAVYAAGVLEYLVAEVSELAGNAARDNKKQRITPRHIYLAIRNDEELVKIDLLTVFDSLFSFVLEQTLRKCHNRLRWRSSSDPSSRLRLALFNTISSMFRFSLNRRRIPKVSKAMDQLERVKNPRQTKVNEEDVRLR